MTHKTALLAVEKPASAGFFMPARYVVGVGTRKTHRDACFLVFLVSTVTHPTGASCISVLHW